MLLILCSKMYVECGYQPKYLHALDLPWEDRMQPKEMINQKRN